MNHQRRSIRIDQGMLPGVEHSLHAEGQCASAILADNDIGKIAQMRSIRILGTMPPCLRIPMPACAGEIGRVAFADHMDMHAMRAGGQANGSDLEFERACVGNLDLALRIALRIQEAGTSQNAGWGRGGRASRLNGYYA